MEIQELAIKVDEIIKKSGVGLELDVTDLYTLAERAKTITSVTDENFKEIKKALASKRKEISEGFMEARAEFNRMSKGIIEVQNILLDIFKPEEDRFIALDKAEKERLLTEARLAALPAKRERIDRAGIEFTDEEILALDDANFEIEYNVRLGAKLEADRIAENERIAQANAAIEAEKAELQRQKEENDRIEAAREEERRRGEEAIRLAKEKADLDIKLAEERRKAEEDERALRLEREEKERLDRIKREDEERAAKIVKEEADKQAKAEAEAEEERQRQANAKFQEFLKLNNYNVDTDIIQKGIDGNFKLYRLIATYEPK